MGLPTVDIKQAEGFGKVWHHNGVGIILNDSHYKFARDFANVVLRNFVQMCEAEVKKNYEAEQAAAKKSEIVLA